MPLKHPSAYNAQRIRALEEQSARPSVGKRYVIGANATLSVQGFTNSREPSVHVGQLGRVREAVQSPIGELRTI